MQKNCNDPYPGFLNHNCNDPYPGFLNHATKHHCRATNNIVIIKYQISKYYNLSNLKILQFFDITILIKQEIFDLFGY